MRNIIGLLTILSTLFVACAGDTKTDTTTANGASDTTTVMAPPSEEKACYTYTFGKGEKLDSINVRLNINGDIVTGEMDHVPYEKDSARGTLACTKSGNTITGTYSYTIEGSEQTEEVVLTLDGDKLIIMQGELDDKKNDGNLTLKDKTKLTKGETLNKVACKS